LDQPRQLQQICRAKPALARRQNGEWVLWLQIRPTPWNLTLVASLVHKAHSGFATVLLLAEEFKLTTSEWVKWMGDPKLL